MNSEQCLANHYAAAGGTNVGAIPWALIIQLIVSLLGGCTTAKGAKRWARRHPEACKDMIADKLKEERTFASSGDRAACVEAAYKTLLAMPDEEINTLL